MSSYDNDGVSVIALLIFLGVLLFGGIMCNSMKSSINPTTAEKEFIIWSKEFGLHIKHVNCNSIDSDGDGYVSCSYSLKDSEEIHQVECAGAWNFQHGCRLPKVKVNVNNQ